MFIKLNKNYLKISALSCCCAALFTPATGEEAADADVVRDITKNIAVTTVERDQMRAEASRFLEEGNLAYSKGRFEEAVNAYLSARDIFQTLAANGNEFFTKELEDCRKRISECYYYWAATIADEAEKLSSQERYDEAIALCEKAKEVSPAQAEVMDARIEVIKLQKEATARRNEFTPESMGYDPKAMEYSIAVLMKQGDRLFYAEQYDKARDKYEEVLRLDPTNSNAAHGVIACSVRSSRVAKERALNTHNMAMAGAAWNIVIPLHPEGEFERTDLIQTPISKSVGDNVDLQTRLEEIIIPEINFEGIELQTALQDIMKASIQNDPAEVGVNIQLFFDPYRYHQEMLMLEAQAQNYLPGMENRNTMYGGGMMGGMGMAGNPVMRNNNPMANNPVMRNNNPMANNPVMRGNNNPYSNNPYADPYGYEMGYDEMEEIAPPTVNLQLTNKSVGYILDALCKQLKLKKRVERNAVLISSSDYALDSMETQIFPLDRDVLISLGDGEVPAALGAFFYGYGVEFPMGSRIVYDQRISRLIVTNTRENLDKLEDIILNQFQVREPLVEIQTKILEITQNDLQELAFNYSLSNNPNNDTMGTDGKFELGQAATAMSNYGTDSQDNIFSYNRNVNGFDFSFSLHALDQADSQDMLYSPRVTTLNGQPVSIRMVEQMYLADDYEAGEWTLDSSESYGSDNYQYTYMSPFPEFDDYTEYGITFVVTPEVDLRRREISLRVNPTIRTFLGWTVYNYANIDDSGTTPSIFSDNQDYYKFERSAIRTTDSLVTVKDGETVAMGGLITDRVNSFDDKVPVLGDIPLIGRAFTSKGTKAEKANLVIFITCKLVNPDGTRFFQDDVRNTGVPAFERYE